MWLILEVLRYVRGISISNGWISVCNVTSIIIVSFTYKAIFLLTPRPHPDSSWYVLFFCKTHANDQSLYNTHTIIFASVCSGAYILSIPKQNLALVEHWTIIVAEQGLLDTYYCHFQPIKHYVYCLYHETCMQLWCVSFGCDYIISSGLFM